MSIGIGPDCQPAIPHFVLLPNEDDPLLNSIHLQYDSESDGLAYYSSITLKGTDSLLIPISPNKRLWYPLSGQNFQLTAEVPQRCAGVTVTLHIDGIGEETVALGEPGLSYIYCGGRLRQYRTRGAVYTWVRQNGDPTIIFKSLEGRAPKTIISFSRPRVNEMVIETNAHVLSVHQTERHSISRVIIDGSDFARIAYGENMVERIDCGSFHQRYSWGDYTIVEKIRPLAHIPALNGVGSRVVLDAAIINNTIEVKMRDQSCALAASWRWNGLSGIAIATGPLDEILSRNQIER